MKFFKNFNFFLKIQNFNFITYVHCSEYNLKILIRNGFNSYKYSF